MRNTSAALDEDEDKALLNQYLRYMKSVDFVQDSNDIPVTQTNETHETRR